jgi:hypothetical protein
MAELHNPEENHVLARLSPIARNRLSAHLEFVAMPLGKVLYESGDVLRHVYFPTNSIISLLYVMDDRRDRLHTAQGLDLEQGERRRQFANINRPVAGPTHEKELPVGRHPLQLYSLATPNGVKVTVMLEELLALGHAGAEYDAWLINIREGDQFGSGFVGVNPNSKIPACGPQRADAPSASSNPARY